MIKLSLVTILLFLSINPIFSQWQYEIDNEKNEKILVMDSTNESTFLIQKSKKGEVHFLIDLNVDKECKINEIEFRFDGIKVKTNFKAKPLNNERIEILYDELYGLEGLELFSLYIKKRNSLYVTFLDKCGINESKSYTLKGSSKAIDKMGLMDHLDRTIKILRAKNEKLTFIKSKLPRIENNKLLQQRLNGINVLDVEEVTWKTHNNDRYNIKIRLKLNGTGYKELFGTFRLYRPTKSIKSRY